MRGRAFTDRKLQRVALMVESAVAPRRRMLAGVARYVREHEPWAIYLKPFGVEQSLDHWLRQWNGDGIIAAVHEIDAEALRSSGIPIVDVVGLFPEENVPLVHANDRSVGRVGAEHLLERGYRNFAFVQYPLFWATDRRQGFEQVVAAAGYKCDAYQLAYPSAGLGGPGFWEQQQKNLVDWIRSLPKPTGVMTSTDLLGQQFLEACQRAAVVVPEQVAVVGADNDELVCNICFPPLSSVVINDDQRGYMAAALLDQLMQGKRVPRQPVYVEPSGVVSRASTDILAIDDPSLAAALHFLRDHACDGIGVDDVVRAVPLSRSVLERRFRKVVGRSINDEIVRVRLNRAVELLSVTTLEIKSIAQKAGFGSPSYMGAVFREKLGRSPGSYRARAKRPMGQLSQGAVPESATALPAT
ncbi:MAG TPA: DNA-binding transcriptional regulator [Tepidisphaeraceae bacterium]|nr:DNA-binding transcriptional regulator [Tepidisphaeraceae bacterium]